MQTETKTTTVSRRRLAELVQPLLDELGLSDSSTFSIDVRADGQVSAEVLVRDDRGKPVHAPSGGPNARLTETIEIQGASR